MEKRFQEVEELVAALRRDVGELQRQLFDSTVDRKEMKASLNELELQITRLTRAVTAIHQLAVSTSDNQEFLVKKLAELTDQVNRLEEELGLVKRSVFEHTILLKNLRRDVEGLKTDVAKIKSDVAELKSDLTLIKSDVAELKGDVAQIKSDVADLKIGQTQILEAIQNLKK